MRGRECHLFHFLFSHVANAKGKPPPTSSAQILFSAWSRVTEPSGSQPLNFTRRRDKYLLRRAFIVVIKFLPFNYLLSLSPLMSPWTFGGSNLLITALSC